MLSLVLSGLLAAPTPPPPPPPTDAECVALPAPHRPFAFGTGERLEFELDALGAQAGKMTMEVRPAKDGLIPIEVRAQTNTFFSKVRRVKGGAISYLHPRTLKPQRYWEDATENELRRTAEVRFSPKERKVEVAYTIGRGKGKARFEAGNDALDVAGAIYLMRQLPWNEGARVCFDVYGIRKLWRLSGKVEGKEHVSLPVGEFEAWHLSGEAVRLDNHQQRREVHVWVSADARRLPLVALGALDLGAVRATLSGFTRPGDKQVRAEGSETLKW